MSTNSKNFVHYAINARSEDQQIFVDNWGNSHVPDFKSSHQYGYDPYKHWADLADYAWDFHFRHAGQQIDNRQLTKKQRKAMEHSLRLYYFEQYKDEAADNGPYGRII